jgi:uncharacterized protein (TIGR00251 family)
MITVHVQPNASANEVTAFADGTWRVKIAAPPVKGKANRELLAFLGEALGVPDGSITIEKGHAARRKLIAISGLAQDEISRRLSFRFSSSGDATMRNRA